MITFAELCTVFRALLSSWAMLICIGFIYNGVKSAMHRRLAATAMSVLLLVFPYFIFQIANRYSDFMLGRRSMNSITAYVSGLPASAWIALLLLLTLQLILCIRREARYERSNITSVSVKEAADELPTGMCYYNNDGQVVLVNYRMNELSHMLSGTELLNGHSFAEKLGMYSASNSKNTAAPRGNYISREIKLSDGCTYRFIHREIELEGNLIHEIIADDVTVLREKIDMLKADNERLRLQNVAMREYGDRINQTIRQEEILRAKAAVHDEMNRLLLASDRAISNGSAEERRQIVKSWQRNILLLCMEAENDSEYAGNTLKDIEELARHIGIQIYLFSSENRQSDTENKEIIIIEDSAFNTLHNLPDKIIRIFLLSIEEAMTNAVKHGNAEKLYVSINNNSGIEFTFRNDGNAPDEPIREAGGLSSLRHRVEAAGGIMTVGDDNGFVLTITIPDISST